MDGQTDRFAISISRVSVLTRDKNRLDLSHGVSKVIVIVAIGGLSYFIRGNNNR